MEREQMADGNNGGPEIDEFEWDIADPDEKKPEPQIKPQITVEDTVKRLEQVNKRREAGLQQPQEAPAEKLGQEQLQATHDLRQSVDRLSTFLEQKTQEEVSARAGQPVSPQPTQEAVPQFEAVLPTGGSSEEIAAILPTSAEKAEESERDPEMPAKADPTRVGRTDPEEIFKMLQEKTTGMGKPEDMPEKEDAQGQREWMWKILMRISETGARLGENVNYSDALKLSASRSYLNDEIVKELDAYITIYNQAINFANAGDFASAEQYAGSIKYIHFQTLFHRPEIARAFKLWEKYAHTETNEDGTVKKNADGIVKRETILKAVGDKLETEKDDLGKELKGKLEGEKLSNDSEETKKLRANFGARFGEYFWRVNERAAMLDSQENTGLEGSGEYFLRRIFHAKDAVHSSIKKGLNRGKKEMADHFDLYVKDWLSDFLTSGDKDFWKAQPDSVKDWYRKARSKPNIIDERGRIWDLSGCPFEDINFLASTNNPNGAAMVGHVAIGLTAAEKTRSEFTKAGALLEDPSPANLLAAKELFSNLAWRNEDTLKKREENLESNAEATREDKLENVKALSPFRQEALNDLLSGMVEYLLKNNLTTKETLSDYIKGLSSDKGGLIGKVEGQQQLKELYPGLSHRVAIPLRKINWLGASFAMLLEMLKQIFGMK